MDKWGLIKKAPKNMIRLGAGVLLVLAWVLVYNVAYFIGHNGLGGEFGILALLVALMLVTGRKI
jgi:hypothetical protein